MAKVEITSASTGGGSIATGVLQLLNGVAMSSSLVSVTDQNNTTSPLKLSTGGVQVQSTLQITTNSNPYIDAEDGSGNNRFTVGRDPSSQVVNIDFASNPTGGTNQVGAIRTYTDGVNLAEVMSFRKDGNVGVGTTAPTETLDVNGQIRTRTTTGVNIFGAGSLGLNDAHIFLNQAQGAEISYGTYGFSAVGGWNQIGGTTTICDTTYRLGTLSLGARLGVRSSGSTSATTSLLVQNSSGSTLLSLRDDKVADFNGSTILNVGTLYANAVALGFINSSGNAYSVMRTNNSTGNATFDQFVAIGTTSAPNSSAALDVVSTTKGFLPPRMTNAQRAAIASPAEGLQIHNTTNNGVAYYDGTNWGYLSGAKQSITITGATQTIFGGNGNIVALTMQSSTTLTFSNHVVGTYIFQITQGGTGSYTITWPVSVLWSGGTAPTLTTTVGKTDIVTLFHDGTNFYGTYSLNY